uniref:Uncharacterized protein n=1 Tax=Babesia bovis TaxID=5865 RepID=S6B5Z0_BABBO|nr:hypothetical protein [Babesia bovis]
MAGGRAMYPLRPDASTLKDARKSVDGLDRCPQPEKRDETSTVESSVPQLSGSSDDPLDLLGYIVDKARGRDKRVGPKEPSCDANLYAKGGLIKRSKTSESKHTNKGTVGDSGRSWKERIARRRMELGNKPLEPIPTRQQRAQVQCDPKSQKVTNSING